MAPRWIPPSSVSTLSLGHLRLRIDGDADEHAVDAHRHAVCRAGGRRTAGPVAVGLDPDGGV
eukprot:2148422-Alexandrium_andersonii.AAC.1